MKYEENIIKMDKNHDFKTKKSDYSDLCIVFKNKNILMLESKVCTRFITFILKKA